VFKWLMNTKDSEAGPEWQGLFAPQEGSAESGTKTAGCAAPRGISKVFPLHIHRLFHKLPGRRAVGAALQFCDSEIVSQRSMRQPG
jgi:hypothetical protein